MRLFSIFISLLLFSQIIFGQEKQHIAVVRLDVSGISDQEGAILTDRLINELFATRKFTVLEREKMEEILKEQEFQLSGCTSTECMMEVGKLVGVQAIVGGSVGTFGSMYTINIRMIDVESGAMVRQASFDYKGDIEAMLTFGMKKVATELAGMIGSPEFSDTGPAEIRLNEQPPKSNLPFRINVLITLGNYSMAVEKLSDDLASRGIILKKSTIRNVGIKFQVNAHVPELHTSFYFSNFTALGIFQNESYFHDNFSEQVDRSWPNANNFGLDIHPWKHVSFGLGYTLMKVKFNLNTGADDYFKDVKGLFYNGKFYVFGHESPWQTGAEFQYTNADKVELMFIGLFFKKNF